MDTTLKIKQDLIASIEGSDDLGTLKTLKKLLDSNKDCVYKLSEAQEVAIEYGREQIKKGEVIPHEALMSEMKKWLKNQ